MLRYRTVALTSLALLAFAGNSVLTRLALADGVSDPVSFTMISLISGAVVSAYRKRRHAYGLWRCSLLAMA